MTVAGNSSVSASAIFYSCADNHSRRTVDSPRNQRPIDAYDGRDRVGRLLCLARISAERGLERDCREYVSWARYIANACGWVGLEARACGVLGLLEVGLGKFAAAVEQFDSCARMLAGAEREDSDELVWAADQVEALIALARYPRAAEVCRSEQVRAERTRSRLVYASAARCRALIADTESFVMCKDGRSPPLARVPQAGCPQPRPARQSTNRVSSTNADSTRAGTRHAVAVKIIWTGWRVER
jgi:hypothetical protein